MATLPMIPTSRLPADRRRLGAAAALALGVEMMLIAGAWALLSHHSAPPAPEQTLTMLSLASVPASVVAPVSTTATKPEPKPNPKPQPPKSRPVSPVHQVVRPVSPPDRVQPVPPVATATPSVEPVAPVDPAPVVHPPAPSVPPGPGPNFAGKLRAAIQAAIHYPESARMSGVSGRARIGFTYRDGIVSNVTVIVSSGMALLDQAALRAVQEAQYPRPEPAYAGRTLPEQLWVNFNLDEQE